MSKSVEFIWGTAEEVSARARKEEPSFRLVNPSGGLPAAQGVFDFGRGEARPSPVRALVRGGRAVGETWEDDFASYCLLAGVLPQDVAAARGAQASSVFLEMEGLLAEAGMTFANVVRTWLYIDRVCEWYGEFNAARTAFFESRGVFDTFLPASTGIGTANLDGAAITAGAVAVKPKDSRVRAEIVESPLQAPAMEYRSSFSRAAEISRPGERLLLVSGTASIKPNSHDVAFVGDIARQIDCTMNAVGAILKSRGCGWGDVTRAVVYLKEPVFAYAWHAWLAAYGLREDFAMETVCDVCRDEWLFEIELDARVNGA